MIKLPDYFGNLVEQARARAENAMVKFPQPNYVLNKVAEESGEVIKAVIHYTEGRETWENVEAELIDNLAMLIRLVKEGDQVIGFTPPAEVQRLNAAAQMNVIEQESMKNLKWLFDLSKTCHALGVPVKLSDSQVEKIAEAFLELEQRLNATAQPVSDGCKMPEGWKLVPIEPTSEMKRNFFRSDFSEWRSEHKDGLECYYHDNVMRIWRNMLAAAPGGQDE